MNNKALNRKPLCCYYCQNNTIIKHGTHNGLPRWACVGCKKTMTENRPAAYLATCVKNFSDIPITNICWLLRTSPAIVRAIAKNNNIELITIT